MTRVYTDNTGRDWVLSVTVRSIRRVRDLTGFDLMDMADIGKMAGFVSDPVLMADVLYAQCKPAAEEAHVSDEQFGEALIGDAIERAVEALFGALVDFFPKARGERLLAVWEESKAIETAATAMAMEQVTSGSMRERAIEQLAAEIGASGKPSATAPGSAGSTPPT